MSVDQLPPGSARPAKRDAQLVRYDEYIDKQIQATRRSVKTVDIMTAILVMLTGTLGFLLTAAIVEHWLVPDGFNLAERMLLFLVLFGSLAFYTTRRLWPLIAGSINPAYAAQAIEHDNPSLKNSLLNLLLFREHRDDITDAVYETLEEQAAKRLTRVPVDSAVDRTQLLRLGYVLIGILAAVALYKILSPKDPFISAERVLMPWARIVPASRVSIENVEPGAITVARGDVLTVSADIRGISDDDPVVVRYTTADGQAVDRPAPMTPSSAGLRFTGQIPPATDGAKAGVAQNLRYRIEAGDARSLEYAVTVVSAPTITIERIDYDYPDYTLYADRSVERLGDIRAIEGTRVTIHARANEPIEDAAIDFEADGRRDVRLTPAGSDAKAAFTLELRDDRQTPKFTSYVLRFTGTSGRPNRDPVKFPIDVAPDRGPEVSILAPAEKTRDVRVDETVAIEVDSIDPDFALAEVRLQGEAAGNRMLDEKLLAQEHTGRYTGRHLFTPHEHDLKPGDVVRYWVTARDNRAPQPNEVTSDSQTLRIVGPNAKQPGQPPQDRIAQRDKPDPQPGGESKEGQQQEGEGGQSGGQSSDSSAGNQQGESQGESASADGQKGQSGEQNSSNQSRDGDSQSTESQSTESQSTESQSTESQSTESQSGESQSGNNSGGKGKPSAGDESSAGEKGNESDGEPASAGGNQTKPGQNGKPSDANQDPSQQPGANQSGSEQDNTNPSEGKPGSNNEGADPKSGSDHSPVSSEGDNDGEAFERIQDFLKQQGKLPKEGESKDPGESASGSSEQGRTADGQTGNPSENAKPNNKGNQSDSNADSKSEQNQQGEPASAGGKEPHPSDSNDPSRQSSADKAESSDPSEQTADKASSENNQESKSPDGQHTSSEGESGAGNQPEKSEGSPESQPESKPGDKWQQKPSGDKQGEKKGDGQDPPSGGQGKKKNDSQGDQGGDRSGGGEEGAGQKSEREGTGSAGQNQSADEGAGESSEQGAGHNSPDAGTSANNNAKSNDPTGQSGNEEKGNGSTQREGTGEQSGGAQNQNATDQGAGQQQSPQGEPASAGGEQPETENSESNSPNSEKPNSNSPNSQNPNPQQPNPAESQPNQSQPNQSNPSPPEQNSQQPNSDQPSAKQPSPLSQDSNSSSSTADGAGRVPNGTMQPSASTGDAPAADAANLEYARRETDLVLETLAEQMKRKQVDKKMLDKLGWSEADLKRFLDRWQQLKAAADDNSPVADEAQRELDDALRSLGLRRGQLQQSKATDDTNRNLRQGYRGAIPLEYQERLRAYNQGVSRARQSDE